MGNVYIGIIVNVLNQLNVQAFSFFVFHSAIWNVINYVSYRYIKCPFHFFFAVVRQPYDIRVEGYEVFVGNVAFLRCFIPEHVRNFVVVSSWFRGDEELLAEMADLGMLKDR